MSDLQRSLALATAMSGSLLIVSIGLAAAVEAPRPDWVLLIVGAALFVVTVIPLARGRRASHGHEGGRSR